MTHKDDIDNHSNQCNSNNDAYWESRGYDERPDDWEDRENDSSLFIFYQSFESNVRKQVFKPFRNLYYHVGR